MSGCSIDLQRQADDPAIHTPKHLRGVEAFFIPFNLLRGQAGKAVTALGSTAQEECPAHNVIYLPILIPKPTVGRLIGKFRLVTPNQGNGIIEWVNRLNPAANDIPHSIYGIANLSHLRFVFRLHN